MQGMEGRREEEERKERRREEVVGKEDGRREGEGKKGEGGRLVKILNRRDK